MKANYLEWVFRQIIWLRIEKVVSLHPLDDRLLREPTSQGFWFTDTPLFGLSTQL